MSVENLTAPAEVAAVNAQTRPEPAAPPVKSLCKHSYLEALRYKWIESEKAGYDLGDRAIGDWLTRHWHGWCRARWIEHITGETVWVEFNADAFSSLARNYKGDRLLLDRVLDRLRCGSENLDVIIWASEWKVDVESVIEILSLIDINRARIDPAELFASEMA